MAVVIKVSAVLLIMLFTAVSAYVAVFGKRSTLIHFDYFVFALAIIAALVVGGAL